MDSIVQADQYVFQLINQGAAHPWLDWLMPVWREKTTWIPLYLALAIYLIRRFRQHGLYLILALGLTVGVADTISSKVIKPAVQRPRPCNDAAFRAEVDTRIHCGVGYSFTSSHATNHFAIAGFVTIVLTTYLYWMGWFSYLWAGSIALGQVYVGVHYPLDILAGGLIGTLIGYLLGKTYLRYIGLGKQQQPRSAK